MKIAITTSGPTLSDNVEARFGRCAYFLVVDTDSMQFEAIMNPNVAAGGGAGIQSAQLLADKGVQAILTGNCGPNAFQVFGAAGIQVVVGVSGSASDAVTQYKQGVLLAAPEANVVSHFGMGGGGMGRGMGGGMGGGRGMGGGMGGGRGMGQGMGGGRGMGQGMGAGRGMAPPSGLGADAAQAQPAEDVESLKAQATAMQEHLQALTERIASLQGATADSALVAVVDSGKCTACGVCVDACPPAAISLNDLAEVDVRKCTGCGRCVTACPQDALSLHTRP